RTHQQRQAETQPTHGRNEIERDIDADHRIEADDTKHGAGRHVIAGDRKTVLGASDFTLRSVKGCAPGIATGRPYRDAQGDEDGGEEIAESRGDHASPLSLSALAARVLAAAKRHASSIIATNHSAVAQTVTGTPARSRSNHAGAKPG